MDDDRRDVAQGRDRKEVRLFNCKQPSKNACIVFCNTELNRIRIRCSKCSRATSDFCNGYMRRTAMKDLISENDPSGECDSQAGAVVRWGQRCTATRQRPLGASSYLQYSVVGSKAKRC